MFITLLVHTILQSQILTSEQEEEIKKFLHREQPSQADIEALDSLTHALSTGRVRLAS
jgi:hypothetical protein